MLPAPTVDVRGRAGRYLIFDELASGGMAAVHLGRLLGSAGFQRTVAIKRLHAHFAKDPEFVAMFTDEARLAARIRHPNVAGTLDVVSADNELFLVMEYIHGESLSKVLRTTSKRKETVPIDVAVAIGTGVLHGLHAAHEATTESGEPLGVVHRDVSPQNVMVGKDGIPRVVDFGVAKAVGRLQTTRDGEVKGKTGYVAPEQLRGRPVDRRADVYAAAVVLWETLTGHRLFVADSSAEIMMQVLTALVEPPSAYREGISPALDALVLRGLARDPDERFGTALQFAMALEAAIALPSPRDVGQWLESAAGDVLDERAARIAAIERHDVSDLRIRTIPTSFEPVSVRAVAPPPPAPRRSRVLPIALALAVTVIACVLVVLSRRPHVETVSQTPVTITSTAPLPAASVVAEPTVASAAPVEPPPIPPATKTVSRVPGAPSKVSKPAPSAARKPAPRCDPPYTVDADGIHIPKAECE